MDSDEKLVLKVHSFNGDVISEYIEVSKSYKKVDITAVMKEIDPNYQSDTNYQFYICKKSYFESNFSEDSEEITNHRTEILDKCDIAKCLQKLKISSTEDSINMLCVPESTFRVHPATRCSSTIEGHQEAVLCCKFSANCRYLATGGGDNTCKIISMQTELMMQTLKASSWVMAVSFSLDGQRVIYGDKRGFVYTIKMKDIYSNYPAKLKGHSDYISCICHRPYWLDPESKYIATCSKDKTIIIWDLEGLNRHLQLSGHLKVVSCIVWTGSDMIISGSNDTIVNIWDASNGACLAQLKGHAHWVNYLSVSSDWVLSTSFYDSTQIIKTYKHLQLEEFDELSVELRTDIAQKRYQHFTNGDDERFISCSDDFKIILWNLNNESVRRGDDKNGKQMIISKLHGHQQSCLMARFSPNGMYIASVSFDKSLRIYDGYHGACLKHLHSHIGPVYCVSWSADSRYVSTCSKDSTLKIWEIKSMSRREELHSHYDEVYCMDWSSDGTYVASGGKDKMVKVWRN